ncbi:MAG TPA: 23S rRNA (adenine(2503)-C(2))-methyltransferase RlmN [Candidatus Dormibacteraeota bacterium]|nr:23S rRNA (adenine(2503)-C(2))-methyltransferase RlmN [Candidatus Dormibacteraeota bacterium]
MQVKRPLVREPFTLSDEEATAGRRDADDWSRIRRASAGRIRANLDLPTAIPDLPAFATASLEDVATVLTRGAESGYRAQQAQQWFWQRLAPSYDAMRTLPASARRLLGSSFAHSTVTSKVKRSADGGQTVKYLFVLRDGRTVETVVMHYEGTQRSRARTTICVSSQVGCPIGCTFCATGRSGFDRNLTEAEIVDQFLQASRDLQQEQRSLTNVVFMGMGEPMNNYQAVVGAVRRWAAADTLNFSPRRVTISTIGLVPFIERLSVEGLPVNLAISLHAPDDELRSRLIPVNRKYPIAAVIAAARAHSDRTGRRTSYEYVLLEGVNDSREQAARLARLVNHRLSHVNLIPMNPIDGSPLAPPSKSRAQAFQSVLLAAGISTTIRATRGLDIDAACGQLRARQLHPAPTPV